VIGLINGELPWNNIETNTVVRELHECSWYFEFNFVMPTEDKRLLCFATSIDLFFLTQRRDENFLFISLLNMNVIVDSV